jgi:hypothetical protein
MDIADVEQQGWSIEWNAPFNGCVSDGHIPGKPI